VSEIMRSVSRWARAFVFFAFASCFPALAQEQLKLFVGYSFLRPAVTYEQSGACPAGTCPVPPPPFASATPNFKGYEFSATYKLIPWLGATADFSGHYGTVTGSSSGHVQTYLFGPELALPAKVAPFVHALVGVAHQAVGSGTSSSGLTVVSTGNHAVATAIGGGIDLHAAPFLSFRAIQLDYLMTRFNSSSQNEPRVSAGVVLRF
jgi:hypothetical protein